MATIFKILSSLTLNITDFTTKLKTAADSASRFARTAEKEFKRIGQTLRSAGKDMLFVAAGPAYALKKSLELYGRQSAAVRQLGVVLKSTGGAAGWNSEQIQAMASSLQKVTTYGDEAIIEGTNLLLTFTGIKENLPDATLAMLNMSQALGQDLKSSAIQLGKALNSPSQGINALRRVGVSFLPTQIKLVNELEKQGKVAEAQKVILRELAIEFGGSATAASKGFGGQVKQLSNLFGDLMEVIGGLAIPVMKDYVKVGRSIVESAFNFTEKHKRLAGALVSSVAYFVLVLTVMGTFKIAIGQTLIVLSAFIKSIRFLTIGLPKLVIANAAAIGSFLLWAAVIGLVAAAIALLVSKDFRDYVRNLEVVRQATDFLFVGLVTAWERVKYALVAAFDYVLYYVKDTMQSIMSTILEGIATIIEKVNILGIDKLDKMANSVRQAGTGIDKSRQSNLDAYNKRVAERQYNRDANIAAAYDSSIFGEQGRKEYDAQHPAPKEDKSNDPSLKIQQDMRDLMKQLVDKQDGLGTNKMPVAAF